VAILPVEDRVDVAAAGQEDPVDFIQDLSRALGDLEHARRAPACSTDAR
jgi:hypothetical protein